MKCMLMKKEGQNNRKSGGRCDGEWHENCEGSEEIRKIEFSGSVGLGLGWWTSRLT